MRVLIILVVVFHLFGVNAYAMQLNGSVAKEETIKKSRVIDKETQMGVGNAQVAIPSAAYSTRTDKDGRFKLPDNIEKPYVVSVKKDGYTPFSLTLKENGSSPLTIGVSKNSLNKLAIESDTYHLGDGMFSDHSANAGEFKLSPAGHIYEKSFPVKKLSSNQSAYISIGSIIGIDTLAAKKRGQTGVKYAYSSAPRVFFNSQEISQINLNGDNRKIPIPRNLIRQGQNVVKIVAGINLFQHDYTDYDDFEFTHLFLEVE